MIKKTKPTRGRPRKHPKPEPEQVSRKVSESGPVKGVISEDELMQKVQQVKATADSLPESEHSNIPPGNELEKDLLQAAGIAPEPEPGEEGQPLAEPEKKPEAPPVNKDNPQSIDAICDLENALLLTPIEFGIDLPKGFLQITEQEKILQAQFRPDEIVFKKSSEWYWGINITLLFSKFLKWLFWNMRNKREAKRKAEALKKATDKTDREEQTRAA